MRYKINLLLILFFIGVIWANQATAQEQAPISITPHIIDAKAKARDILKYDVVIKNNTDRKINVYAFVNDVSTEEGKQEFIDPNYLDKTESLARWIKFRRAQIELEPGGEVTEPLEIDVNLSATPGKRYAVIAFPQGRNSTVAEENLKEKSVPQLMINLEIEENIVERAQISDFSTDRRTYLNFPVKFGLNLANSGNRPVKPEGTIYIYNRRGQEIDKIAIAAEDPIVPGQSGLLETVWAGGRGFGKFKARLEIEYGEKDVRDLADTIYFWVMPIGMLLIYGCFLLVLVGILTYFIFKKTYNHHPAAAHAFPVKKEPAGGPGVLDLRE